MKKKLDFQKLRTISLYVLSGAALIALLFAGVLNKAYSSNTDLTSLDVNDTRISTDKLTELYVVADLSNALNLASAGDVAYNYVATSSLYEIGQASIGTGKLEKNITTDTSNFSRGVISYVVSEGETMEDIADKFGLTTDQIRWSNDLKTTDIEEGDTLYLTKNVSGIVYTVKEDDTLESIADTYGSTAEDIMHLNDIEVSGISEGMRIAIEGGTLPEEERPEYVAPTPVVRPTTTYYYTTVGASGSRLTLTVVNSSLWLSGPYASGQCTSYAWSMRPDLPGTLGNAYSWAANAAAAGFPVDHNPQPGDVFQSMEGYYGHVGYVVDVNDDGTILIREMNYNYRAGVVTESLISASAASSFNYIHYK